MEKVASKYATAFFNLAVEKKCESRFLSDIKAIDEIIFNHPELIDVLKKIQFSKIQKKSLINDIFLSHLDSYSMNLLYLLVDKNRISIIQDLVKEYYHLHNNHFNIIEAIAYSVTPLTKEEIKSLEQSLSEKENQTVSVINRIDPTLISGIKVRFDNRVIDGSM